MKSLFATIALAFTLCGIAQAQTFTGFHPTSNYCGGNPNGENGCAYVGNITGDPYAAYAQVTDQTGASFPAYHPRWTPPTVNSTGPWTGVLTWENGAQVSGTTTIASGTCTTQGAPVPTTSAPHIASPVVYTVNCSGLDTNGQPLSKTHKYYIYFATSRAGGFWQQPVDAPFATVTFNAAGSVAGSASPAILGGTTDYSAQPTPANILDGTQL